MRQVPHYTLIGNGRLALHLQNYFTQSGLAFNTWSRQSPHSLESTLIESSHILVLISDDAISNFIDRDLAPYHKTKIIIHCSGCLFHPKAYGAHPLMTFHENPLDLNIYQSIPFVLDQNAPDFNVLFPGLPNPSAKISPEHKALYHTLAVLSGNFTVLLWQKALKSYESLNLPPDIHHVYAKTIFDSILNQNAILTGPLPRQDENTLAINRQALENDPYQAVFDAFVNAYQKEHP